MLDNTLKVVSHHPTIYPRQQGLTCGEYNVRGLLQSFGVPYQPPQNQRLRIRLFGLSFIEDISQLLTNHGLIAPVLSAKDVSDSERIEILRQSIDEEHPILLAIGNGHLSRNVYSPLARMFVGHFITIYGYSLSRECFYIYDPYLDGAYPEEIPVGNEVRTFDEMTRDWNGTFYYRWIKMDHVFIPVNAHGAN